MQMHWLAAALLMAAARSRCTGIWRGCSLHSQSCSAVALTSAAVCHKLGVADALAGSGSADGGSPQQAALAQLEAGLERAQQRGRPLVLVNSAVCPNMSWEPSSSESGVA
jgi:hypothetical protein